MKILLTFFFVYKSPFCESWHSIAFWEYIPHTFNLLDFIPNKRMNRASFDCWKDYFYYSIIYKLYFCSISSNLLPFEDHGVHLIWLNWTSLWRQSTNYYIFSKVVVAQWAGNGKYCKYIQIIDLKFLFSFSSPSHFRCFHFALLSNFQLYYCMVKWHTYIVLVE